MLVGVAVVGAVGLVTAEASAKRRARKAATHHRVIAAINVKFGKTWDGGRGAASKPDITLCVGSSPKGTCLPKTRSGTDTKKPTKAICKNKGGCWIGCDYKNRIYVSATESTKVVVWDVDKYRHDRMLERKCTIRKGAKTACENKYVSVTFFSYDRNLCKNKKLREPGDIF
jgi:hypothetical protein